MSAPPRPEAAADARPGAASPAVNRIGILAMLGAMTFFIIGDTFMKLATETMPISQAVMLRGVIAVPLALGLALALAGRRGLDGMFAPRVLVRSALEVMIVYAFLTALGRMPIGTLTAISQTVPLIITLLAVVLGLERVGIRRWAAIIAGFVGVLLITRPDMGGLDAAAGYAIGCAVLVAVRDLFTRSIVGTVHSTAITASSALLVALTAAAVGAFGPWAQMGAREFACIGAAGIVVIAGNLMMVIASRGADVAVVTPYRYVVVPLGLVAGYLVWGETPAPVAAAGMALIVGAGLYTFHREIVRARLDRRGGAA